MRFDGFEDMLSHWAWAAPESTALIDNDTTCTYAELLRRVRARAETLRRDGGTSMGLLCGGGADCVVTLFGAVAAGMQLVLLDADAPEALLREQIAYTDVDRLCGEGAPCKALSDALSPGLAPGAGRGKVLFFTSGTTSRAKAVVLTERSLCASAWNGGRLLPLSGNDVLLSMLPLDHVFGFVCGLLWGLSSGAAVALGRGRRSYAEDCGFYQPTALAAVPALLRYLVKNRCLGDSLRTVLVGAGDCPWALLKAVEAMGIRVSYGYGLTETSSGVALSTGEDLLAMELCPDAAVEIAPDGEILIRCPDCMFEGYYKHPEATAAVLQNGVLHSGDLGELDAAGRLRVTGRKKEILVLADGSKLFLPEYEKDLARALETSELAVALRRGSPALV
ncbi:MAG: AMP-binding protein, partial [Oscillospiraceae bacterium]|nr:AMP-binding protein [Oscillospiraceae bacterium]